MTFEEWWKQTKPAECDGLKEYFIESWKTAIDAENLACQRLCEQIGMASNGMYERNHECAMAIKARREVRQGP